MRRRGLRRGATKRSDPYLRIRGATTLASLDCASVTPGKPAANTAESAAAIGLVGLATSGVAYIRAA